MYEINEHLLAAAEDLRTALLALNRDETLAIQRPGTPFDLISKALHAVLNHALGEELGEQLYQESLDCGEDIAYCLRVINENTFSNVSVWADVYGVWHVRVSAYAAAPLLAARRLLQEQLQARQGAEVPRDLWMHPVRVAEMDTDDTLVYREGNLPA
jgi:hypothetical protein